MAQTPNLELPEMARRISSLQPDELQAFVDDARVKGQALEAAKLIAETCLYYPNRPDLLDAGGLLFQHGQQLVEAHNLHRQAFELARQNALYAYHLGTVLCQLDQLEDGLRILDHSIMLDNSNPHAWCDYGNASLKLNNLELAEFSFRQAIAFIPDFASAHYGLACALLRHNLWREGWAEFQWRGTSPEMVQAISSKMPLWKGESLKGKHLVIMAEQGYGDVLQFFRYTQDVSRFAKKVSLWAPHPIANLLGRSHHIHAAYIHSNEIPSADFYAPMMSLPHLLQASPTAIPPPPYLRVEAQRIHHFTNLLGPRRERLRLAINWAGNQNNGDDRSRSARLHDLAPLFFDPHIRWISVQQEGRMHEIADLGAPIEDWSAHLATFDDTAGLFTALDGVVSICSAPIHLAGALGLQSACLLSMSADWRWGDDPTHTPWYPTMNLVRQNARGDWTDVARRAYKRLTHWKQRTPLMPTMTGEFDAQGRPTREITTP